MRSIFDASSNQILFYYLVVIIFFFHTLYKFRQDSFFVLIVFIFFMGLFVYAGKSVQNTYRILTVLYAIYLMQRTVKMKTFSKDPLIIISFIFFSLTFLLSSFMNKDNFTLMFSQYSRYLLIFLFYFILLQRMPNLMFQQKINQLLFRLIMIQILLSIVKMLVTGPMESIVGSLSFSGGANAAVIPILGFVFLWMYRRGNLQKNDWFLILGLVFIGFVNYKRAIWFIMPFFIVLFLFYVQRRKINRYLLILVILIPLIIYLGVRLNPTLNKEQKVWGSFDLKYALNYSRVYSFGNPEAREEQQVNVGRGGAMNYLFAKIVTGDLTKTDIFGKGLALMYVEGAKNEEYFVEQYNINSIGSASGFFQFYVVFGFLGTFSTLLFVFSLVRKIKNKRIQFALICMFFWEFFLYTGVMIREPALSFLFIYLIVYSNYLYLNPVYVKKTENLFEKQNKSI